MHLLRQLTQVAFIALLFGVAGCSTTGSSGSAGSEQQSKKAHWSRKAIDENGQVVSILDNPNGKLGKEISVELTDGQIVTLTQYKDPIDAMPGDTVRVKRSARGEVSLLPAK